MSVLVTGGDGFVGRRLCRRLEESGRRAVSFDLPRDVSDAEGVRAAVEEARPEAIVHLAAISHVPDSLRAPALTWRVNFGGARAVLDAAAQVGGIRVLLVGSCLSYGPGEPGGAAFQEDAPLRPGTPYAWTKAAADRLGGLYAARGVDVVRLRPFNHTGAGRPATFVESSFARQLARIERGEQEPTLAVGNLDAVRDFLHVEDVVDAYLRLLDPAVPAGVYNVASGVGVRIGDLLETLFEASSTRPHVERDPELFRPADASVGDAGRLQAATGWKQERSLGEALTELLDAWREALADGDGGPPQASGSPSDAA